MDRLLRVAQTDFSRDDQPASTVIDQAEWVIGIETVEYLKDYTLRLKFSDGKETDVDFGPFLMQSLNPLIRKYLEPTLFRQFTLKHGDLFWNDYDLCFPIADLYEGRI